MENAKFSTISEKTFKDDNMLDDLAIGNKAKGERELAYDIQFQMNMGYMFNDKITLYGIEYHSDGSWTDGGLDDDKRAFNGGIDNGLDLSKIEFGKAIKHDVKKVISLSSTNYRLLAYYNKYIKNLNDTSLYAIKSDNNGLNIYRPLTRSELISIGFEVSDTDNVISEPQYTYYWAIQNGNFVLKDSREC